MLRKIRALKSQSTLEYAILVVVIIAALLSLQTYIKRGIQGRLRKSADDVGDQFSVVDDATFCRTVDSVSVTTETNDKGLAKTIKAGDIYTNTRDTVKLGEDSEFGE